jgi:uncharacterized glyoxalase superfamily protein PhnB
MIESAFPILEVDDLDVALAFYRDGLGGELVFQFPPEGDAAYVSLAVGSSRLGLGVVPGGRAGADSGVGLWFYVDDVDRVVDELEARGAAVLERPADMPWGERVALVTDPFGTRVRLGRAAA